MTSDLPDSVHLCCWNWVIYKDWNLFLTTYIRKSKLKVLGDSVSCEGSSACLATHPEEGQKVLAASAESSYKGANPVTESDLHTG